MTTTSRHIVIPGGSGFLGQSLTAHLRKHGHRVTILGRSAHPDREGVTYRQWDNRTVGDWADCLDGADAIVNTVGRSVDCRKTLKNKREILESRVNSCRVLGEALQQMDQPPPVWVQFATAHIVGDPVPLDTVCDESAPPGTGMAPDVGQAWEQAFEEARRPEQRGVTLRISFVLGRRGGALDRLRAVTRLGLGGTIGHGNQWVSWIHEHDLNRLILAAIEDEQYRGVYMTTAPHPVTNRDFMRELRHAYQRPWSPPAPTLGVRLASRFVLDTDPELALLGRRCVPRRLMDETGFEFVFPRIDQAMADLAAPEAEPIEIG